MSYPQSAPGLTLPPRQRLRTRFMDPTVGRFVSADPWEGDTARPQTLAKYPYAENDPVNRVDPTGNEAAFAVLNTVYSLLALGQAPMADPTSGADPGDSGMLGGAISSGAGSRKFSVDEITFISRVVDAIFIPDDAKATDRLQHLKTTLTSASLYSGPKLSVTARVALHDPKNGAITLEGRYIYFQPSLFPEPITNALVATPEGQKAISLLVHESIHLEQQALDPTGWQFGVAYGIEGLAKGYLKISSEVEAYATQFAVQDLLKQDSGVYGRNFTKQNIDYLQQQFKLRKQQLQNQP